MYKNKLLLEGVNTRRPAYFKAFLLNEDNKSHVKNRNVMLVAQDRVFKVTSDGQSVQDTEIPAFRSNQEETDSRIIIYIACAQDEGYDRVVVRSPDSDIFFILLSFAHKFQLPVTIFFDTSKRRSEYTWDC